MLPNFAELLETVQTTVGGWIGFLVRPSTFVQFGILVAIFAFSMLLARRIEPPLEAKARKLKINADTKRVLFSFLQRFEWVLFIVFAWVTLAIMREITWPSRSYFIAVALNLALAWLAIAVISSVIKSRVISKSVAIAGWAIASLSIVGWLDEARGLLDQIAFSVGTFRLSLLLVVQGTVLVIGLFWFATAAGNYADKRISSIPDLAPSLKVLLGKVVKMTLLILATIFALAGVGLDLTALAVFSGAVGVGLGFGLQKVVSNYISGIIILMDKSIKPGDTISLGETFGWIRELRARFVSVVTRDGKEYLIPNEDLITEKVVNWSFSNDLIRLDVEFGVSYDSNPHEVSAMVIEAVKGLPRVSDIKAPVCWLTEFGDSSLNFVLRFWVTDPQNGLTNIRGKVMLALWDVFEENNIEIPYPHREIIMKSGALPE
jgi:small-conductance mechanosensitive channel